MASETLRAWRDGTRAVIVGRIERGIEEEDVWPSHSAQAIGAFFMAMLQGLSAQSIDGAAQPELEELAELGCEQLAAMLRPGGHSE